MNITYLIGNGFDLNVGLRTRYSDFIEQYVQDNRDDQYELKEMKRSIAEYYNNKEQSSINWSDMEIAFGHFTNYFCDKEYGDELIQICHTHLCEALAKYLVNEEKRFIDKNIGENKQLIEEIGKSFTSFTKGLQPNDTETIEHICSTIGNGYKISILDFNYTSIMDIIVKEIVDKKLMGTRTYGSNTFYNKIESFLHVHGTTSHGMVFGVNDESQLCKEVFSEKEPERKSMLIKSEVNDAMGENIEKRATEIINGSDLIYIYGMSIGETDRRWWERIINCMDNNRKVLLIINDKNDPAVGLSPFPHIKYQREKKEYFLSYSTNITNNVDEIKERIYTTSANLFQCLEDFTNAVHIPKQCK